MQHSRRDFLKLTGATTSSLAITPLFGFGKKKKPNFVIIFTDDQGYQDLGCFGSPTIKTPNIDRMAKEGRKFTNFYVASPVCSPSRAALMTGCYPKRVNMHQHVVFPPQKHGLHPNEKTLADLLKPQGYATACVGKWHLGHMPNLLPTAQGFDSYFGVPYSNDMRGTNHIPVAKDAKIGKDQDRNNLAAGKRDGILVRNKEIIEYPIDQRQLTKQYTEESVKFIKENKDKPFFLYLPHSMPHLPVYASKNFEGESAYGPYGDTIEEIDWCVGQVLKTLKDLKLEENTYVLFTSDNGPWLQRAANKKKGEEIVGCALPLREGKGTTWEGGMREPCVMWGPGRIPADTTCDEMTLSMDIMPTFAKLAGAKVPKDRTIDGKDVWNLMSGKGKQKTPHKAFLYYTSIGDIEGIRMGDWKLLVHKDKAVKKYKGKYPNLAKIELFNLKEDISESKNLADKYPEKVKELKAEMLRLDKEITENARPRWN